MLAFWLLEFHLRTLYKAHLISAFATSEDASVNSKACLSALFQTFFSN